MTTNISTSNQSLTSKRRIMIKMTFPRQFMRLEFSKQFFNVSGSKISKFL
jgi:hypothetical protein